MLQIFVLLFCVAVCVLPFTSADAISPLNKRAEGKSEVFYPKAVVATLNVNGGIRGTFKFSLKNPNNPQDSQAGVYVEIDLYQVPKGLHPYHIHEKAITNGDCASAGGHYNPTKCDEKTSKCKEVGDLSGKQKPLNGGGEIHLKYHDPSLRLSPSQRGILGRSIVIHSPDMTRLACANIPKGAPMDAPKKRDHIKFLP